MGKASSSKKVNRAAATGGGRTAGNKAPVGWYSALAVVVILGVAGVFFSAQGLREDEKIAQGSPPVANKDHWHVAYGFNLCGEWVDPLADGPRGDTNGIHTHQDGLIHVHPFISSAAGKNATFDKFMTTAATSVSATSLDLKRDGQKYKNGDKCDTKSATLTWRTFKNLDDKTGKLGTGDPGKHRFEDGEIMAISFNPKGFKVTQPPSAANINDPGDLGETPAPTPTESTTPGGEGETTEGETTDTTAAGDGESETTETTAAE